MKTALYTVFACILILIVIRYVYSKLSRQQAIIPSDTKVEPKQPSNEIDDFMCIMLTDGSTITSKGGVTIRGKRKQP